ncbi:MAG: alcohol dehydrogenase catalytic domain-containing protein [Elusimicrobia bacterium]|nr:alcohol dehydrogenase catalytic domain-containing protein [Elusimicrobiota bacterium]
MKAVMFFGPQEIKLVDVPRPEPGPGEVLVRIGAALTCGTDFKAYRQGHRVLLGDLPAPFGHELAGTIEAVGEGVTRFKTGMRVVAANSAPCDNCFYCARGQNQLCDNLRLHNGAYAEFNRVPAQIVKHNLYELPGSLDFKEGALAEPLACAIHGADVMNVQAGERVAIIGAGTMSLLLVQALADRGAKVLVIGRNPERLAVAKRAGAELTVAGDEKEVHAAVKAWADGVGPDCVFEAVGKSETWQQAIGLVRKGGRVCLFGGCAMGTRIPVDAHRVHYEQLHLQGVFHHTPKYNSQAVEHLARGKVKSELLISASIPLAEVPAYFARMHQQSNPKVAVIP